MKHIFSYLHKGLVLCSALSVSAISYADYKEVIEKDFWGTLYEKGGKTYYCDKAFEKKTPLLAVSHIYTGSSIREHLQCGTNRQCMRDDAQYQSIMSDLHNAVAADSYFEFKRKSSIFGTLDKTVSPNKCGFRKKQHLIEPPDDLKGDIARVLLYMHQKYQLPLSTNFSLLSLWNKSDPPSNTERARNEKIKTIQGNENHFVTNPALIDSIDH